jgi:hypothetical protein
MIKYHKTSGDILIAELTDDKFIISEVNDVLELIYGIGAYDCDRIIIRDRNLHDDFYRLRTGLAGDILQKFSNYRVRLAIIGDFSKYGSKSLHDFIRESNRGRMIFFLDTLDSALIKLTPEF